MRASDFRAAARRALSGKWLWAVLAGLIASLLGGIDESFPEFSIQIEDGQVAGASVSMGQLDIDLTQLLSGQFPLWLSSILASALVMGLVLLLLGSVISLGYARFNLDLADGQDAQLPTLFSYFPWFKTAFCARLLTGLYVFLWSLLLLIPGIIASYSYAMTPYILANHPELTAREAIARSKELMSGNRWRLFCLEFSFIGWALLSSLTMGIGSLFLTPYTQAAKAAFYRDLLDPQPDPLLWDL